MRYIFEQPQLDYEVSTHKLHLKFRLLIRGGRPLGRAEETAPECLGWQVFDPSTGLFLWEGEWQPLESHSAIGPPTTTALTIPLPTERGEYDIYVSCVTDGKGWAYQRGEPFLLVRVRVEESRLVAVRAKPTTLGQLIWQRRLRRLATAVTRPFLLFAEHGGLIRSMVRRDLLSRYRGSIAGTLWTVLNPLLLMATYFFVFGLVLRARFPGDPSRLGFALYFLAGMLPWLPVAEALGRAPNVVVEHRNFVKKLVFPVEILPVNLALAGLVTQGFSLAAFLFVLLAARGTIPGTILWLPALIVPQLLLTLGLAWFLAALGVFVRDLGQVMAYLLTLWFFLTPICYPEASLPPSALPVLARNPMYVLVAGFRRVLLEARPPEWEPLWGLWGLSLAVCVAGFAWFSKFQRHFADAL